MFFQFDSAKRRRVSSCSNIETIGWMALAGLENSLDLIGLPRNS